MKIETIYKLQKKKGKENLLMEKTNIMMLIAKSKGKKKKVNKVIQKTQLFQ